MEEQPAVAEVAEMEEQPAVAEKKSGGNIVLFPIMAQGHINPFIDLAHLLLSRRPNLTLTFVSTPANVLRLRPIFASTPSVRLLELPFRSSDHGLPPDSENTMTLSRSGVSRLFIASQSLQPSFHTLISDLHSTTDLPPLLAIISDMFLPWSVDVARAFGLYHAILFTSGPYAMSIYNSVWTHLPHAQTSADEFPVPGVPGIILRRNQLSKVLQVAGTVGPEHPSAAFISRQAANCRRSDAGLWNTVAVLEQRSLDNWERSTGQPAFPIGPLHRLRKRDVGTINPTISATECIEWLDRRPAKSVVFVSFGSCTSIGREQMAGLARALEASGRPFVWVLRPPVGMDAGAAVEEWRDVGLPEGFEERMREEERGLLIRRWAPQVEILEHPATGAFVSHCGWNSLLESMASGVPVVAWPVAAEQFYNAKLLEEEVGVCLEVARGEEAMVEEEMVRVLEEVFEGERGREMRRRAEGLKEEMKRAVEEGDGEGKEKKEKGSSVGALDEFLRTVMERCGPLD